MSTHLELEPKGWPIEFKHCPAGFFVHNGTVGLMTVYGQKEAFLESGCAAALKDHTIVQPVVPKWVEEEE